MTRNLPACLSAIALFLVVACCINAKDKKEYKAKDGGRVVILPIGKLPGHADSESRIEFYSPNNQMLCALDYSSEDSEHGFGVVKAAWTPDNNYFVFSLASSGGHQPWHAPTQFYSVRDHGLRNLDSFVKAAGISKGDFTLQDPNVVLTDVWRDEQPTPVKFRLDSLSSRKSTRVLQCAGGKTIKTEPYSLQPYA
jgi:hypothetical protein